MKKRQMIFVLLVLGLVAVGTVFGATLIAVAAEDGADYPPIIQALADRFDLNPDDVKEVFDERHEAKHGEMQQRHEGKLDGAVEAGTLTEEQKDELLQKMSEFRSKMEEQKDLSPAERFEAMKEHKEELKTWADENDVDLGLLGGCGQGSRAKMGRHMGRGMGHGSLTL